MRPTLGACRNPPYKAFLPWDVTLGKTPYVLPEVNQKGIPSATILVITEFLQVGLMERLYTPFP